MLIGEGCESFGELLSLGRFHDLLAAPVNCKTLEKVVALDVAIVIEGWRVRWVEVYNVIATFERRHIAAQSAGVSAVVEDDSIIFGCPCSKVFPQWKT